MNRRVMSIDCGTRSLGICYVQAPHRILRWCLVDLGSPQIMPATEALTHLLSPRGSLSWMFQTSVSVPLVIELQPQSGPVKTISHVFQALSRLTAPERQVFFMPASRKFQAFAADPDTPPPPVLSGKSYAQRKKLAQTLVQTHSSFVGLYGVNRAHWSFFNAQIAKKRGDLADCFLQGVSFLHNPLVNATAVSAVSCVDESGADADAIATESCNETLHAVAENWRGC